ncbi:pectinesterase family protein [Horticoccus sp. 23ND18S-11]|uniref:pectinesterase family protein n=1 Tax=Horticoccus sp. 23ND18S-11 TaxID=3391832 RepID=UPI0039C96575
MSPLAFTPRCARLARTVLAALLFSLLPLHAQLEWSVFDETASTRLAAGSEGKATVVIPAGQRATLVATNFVPIDFTAPTAATAAVTITFKASGGLSGIGGGTRAIGFGLFNHAGTTPGTTFVDDAGYFTWLNGRSTGSLLELRRRNGNGPSASLLNPTGTSFNTLGTGSAVQTVGALSDGATYSLTLRLVRSANGVSLGTTSANTANAGVVILGDGISQTAFTNPDTPPAATVFNEVGFMFLNTTTAPVTLTIDSVAGLTPINPPGIGTAPQDLIVNPGQAGAFTVAATGTAPLSYQWRRDGTAIAGATTETLALASAQSADAGAYTVVVTNPYGTITSPAARLTVTTATVPATITTQPVALTVAAGQGATFSVAAFGSAPVSYQWRKGGSALAGATTNTLALANVTAADAGDYTVVVSNSAATVTSNAATLTVNTAPVITTQPVNATVATGQSATFTVAATGNPAPTYQWQRNGANLAGATNASLTITGVTLADTGTYTVRIVNAVGAVSSAPAVLAVPSTMVATATFPGNGATGVNIDTPLRITFDRTAVAGSTGRVRIHRASDGAVVDTLDLGVSPQTRLIGTQTTPFIFLPVIATGNTATLYPRAGVLAYGQTYYVTVEQGVVRDGPGASFTGLSDPAAWRFTTKAAGPAANATAVTVAADGSGDFSTVQGAIDFVPLNNTQRVVITVKRGLYNEINYIGSAKPFITVRGEDRAGTVIAYPNNANFNTLTGNNRAMFSCDANDFTLETITLRNTTPAGGSQAEALRGNGQRCIVNRVNLLSLQDTLLWNGRLFVTDSYIEGDVDFMWGNGACYFQRCELKAVRTGFYTQIRNTATTFGNVYVDCRLTSAEGVTNVFLGRIDPNPGNFPFSQCIYINCAMGSHVAPEGWRLDNATSAPNLQYWEHKSTDLTGATLDVSRRIRDSRQLTEAEAALWRDPARVLAGWVPEIAATIETPPPVQFVRAGSVARLTVTANGAPAPTLQWYRNGTLLPGATNATLLLPNAQSAVAGTYTVTATNSGATVTSTGTVLTVERAPTAGTYFGTLGGSATGTFALLLRDNGTGVFLAQSGANLLVARNVTLTVNERIQFSPQTPGGSAVQVLAEGTVDRSKGTVTGAWGGVTFNGARSDGSANTAALAGYYATGVTGGSATATFIVGSSGQVFVLTQNGTVFDAGSGTVNASGAVNIRTAGGATVTATIAAGGASASATIAPATGAAFTTSGSNDNAADALRFRQFSTRAQVTPTTPAIAGFVVTGDDPTTVLVRAVGPTLADTFAVTGALPNPRLELFRGSALLASNTGWSTANNAGDIARGAAGSGAFPLRAAVADSAIQITLAPGTYTAVAGSASGATSGSVLVEVYDLTGGSAGQRLVNLSTRAAAGAGANALIAGFFVSGDQPKRVLARGVGPGLAGFGLGGALARPVISVYRGNTLVAVNSSWSTSADAVAIGSAAAEARAFPFATGSADAALLLHLAPGLYTAQLTSADAAAGAGLIEIYEAP